MVKIEYKYVTGTTRQPGEHERRVNDLSSEGWLVLTVVIEPASERIITIMYKEK